jgi:hypothetical protein
MAYRFREPSGVRLEIKYLCRAVAFLCALGVSVFDVVFRR